MAPKFTNSATFARAYADLKAGSLGEAINALSSAGGRDEAAKRVKRAAERAAASGFDSRRLKYDIDLIRAIQAAAGPAVSKKLSATPNNREVAAALEEIRGWGREVHGEPTRPTGALPANVFTSNNPASNTVLVEVEDGRRRRFPKTHPVVTGQMVQVQSSNVFAIGYDLDHFYLYVRFLDSLDHGERSGPGPIYRYSGVIPSVFVKFLEAASKGKFIWDNIRIRGTVSGHRYGWELVGVQRGYVPRLAAYLGKGQEGYLTRHIRTDKGRFLKSARPEVILGAPRMGGGAAPR